MTNLPIQYNERYEQLQEDVRAICSEVYFRVESEKLKGKWLVGKAIIDFAPERKYGKAIIKKLSNDLNISERELYYCVKFVDKYPIFIDTDGEPNLDSLEIEGKTPAWSRVKIELLAGDSACKHEETKIKRTEIEVCTCCGRVMKRKEL
jgi:hypothetical protein